jgi:hypothetical protein
MIPVGVLATGQDDSSPPAADFPQVRSSAIWYDSTAGTSHAVQMPATVVPGDLLMQIVTIQEVPTYTVPSGWTVLGYIQQSSAIKTLLLLKVADGSEGGGTVTFTTGSAAKLAVVTVAVSDWSGTLADVYSAAAGVATVSSVNPPSLSPAPGSDNYLWLAVCHTYRSYTFTADPTGFGDVLEAKPGSTTAGATRVLRREEAAATLDPSVFTISGTTWLVGRTVAIRGL